MFAPLIDGRANALVSAIKPLERKRTRHQSLNMNLINVPKGRRWNCISPVSSPACLGVMRHTNTRIHMLSANTACLSASCCVSRAHYTSNTEPAVSSKHTQAIRTSLSCTACFHMLSGNLMLLSVQSMLLSVTCRHCGRAEMTVAASQLPKLAKLLRLNTKEQLPLSLNTGALEGHDKWWCHWCYTHIQFSDAKRQWRDNHRQKIREKKIWRQWRSRVKCGAVGRRRERQSVWRTSETLKGCCKHSNSLTAGRQPKRSRHSSTLNSISFPLSALIC